MSERLTTANVAKMLGIAEETLIKWRKVGRGPAFYRIARANTYYKSADVEQWIEEQKQVPQPKPVQVPVPHRPPLSERTFPARFHGKNLR